MKNFLGMALGLVLVAPSFAATTDVLELSGVVAASFDIVVNDAPAATTLDIAGGAVDLAVASVDETANAAYKITMESDNAGNLSDGAGSNIAYTIKYDGGTATAPGASGSAVQVKTAAAGSDSSAVLLNFTGNPSAAAGTYTDNVTFTIAAQ